MVQANLPKLSTSPGRSERRVLRHQPVLALGVLLTCLIGSPGAGQTKSRKPRRAVPPNFAKEDFGNVFFEDVASVLQGPRPTVAAVRIPPNPSNSMTRSEPAQSPSAAAGWAQLISPTTLEDTIKESKSRLDKLITTPARFAGGGFAEARREFSLLAALFAVIEQYPTEVRWKSSAPLARERFARMSANAKVGSAQAFNEAKQRLAELGDLINGSSLSGASSEEIVWEQVIDRGPMMQLLEWAFKEHLQNFTANANAFSQNKEEVQRAAELVSILGTMAIKDGMPDASDGEYAVFAKAMVAQAQAVVMAVRTGNADEARQAVGQIGQNCAKCHDSYR